jgi:TonB family protein
MKILSLLLLATLLLTNNFNSPQEPAELQEANTLTTSFIRLFNQGKYDEALPLAKRALQIREKHLPRTDPRVADSLTNLGEIYIAKQDYEAAAEVFKRLLKIQQERFGREDVNLAPALDRLAPLYFRRERYGDAEDAFKRALALREKALGSNDELVARSTFALAEFYRIRQNFESAMQNYQRALRLYKQASGTKTPAFERARDGVWCLQYAKPGLREEVQNMLKEFEDPAAAARVGEPGQVLNGRALSLPKPEYPDAARVRGLAGIVVVAVIIDEAGNVISARDQCQGPAYLSEASVAAALKARFTSTKLSGMPVKVTGVIVYNFARL